MTAAGMPRFNPTEEQRKTVETLAGFGIPHDDIASLIISPRTKCAIDCKTLRLAFRVELDTGHVKANSAVAQSLYQQAVGGNVTAAIWWTKARMGWGENSEEKLGKKRVADLEAQSAGHGSEWGNDLSVSLPN